MALLSMDNISSMLQTDEHLAFPVPYGKRNDHCKELNLRWLKDGDNVQDESIHNPMNQLTI